MRNVKEPLTIRKLRGGIHNLRTESAVKFIVSNAEVNAEESSFWSPL